MKHIFGNSSFDSLSQVLATLKNMVLSFSYDPISLDLSVHSSACDKEEWNAPAMSMIKEKVFSYLTHASCPVYELNISGRPLSQRDKYLIQNILKYSLRLQVLVLDNCGLTSEDIHLFLKMIRGRNYCPLKSIRIDNTQLDEQAIQVILKQHQNDPAPSREQSPTFFKNVSKLDTQNKATFESALKL